jgi:hypothetical protein
MLRMYDVIGYKDYIKYPNDLNWLKLLKLEVSQFRVQYNLLIYCK